MYINLYIYIYAHTHTHTIMYIYIYIYVITLYNLLTAISLVYRRSAVERCPVTIRAPGS